MSQATAPPIQKGGKRDVAVSGIPAESKDVVLAEDILCGDSEESEVPDLAGSEINEPAETGSAVFDHAEKTTSQQYHGMSDGNVVMACSK